VWHLKKDHMTGLQNRGAQQHDSSRPGRRSHQQTSHNLGCPAATTCGLPTATRANRRQQRRWQRGTRPGKTARNQDRCHGQNQRVVPAEPE